jgi:hypothetical protein
MWIAGATRLDEEAWAPGGRHAGRHSEGGSGGDFAGRAK